MSYIREKQQYYHTEHFKLKYRNKWVALFITGSNVELPNFVSRGITPNFLPSTSYVDNALIFSCEEHVKLFLSHYDVVNVKPFCLSNIEELLTVTA
jgi:hypothetical protein